jgi:hypothetical protein
MMSARLGRRQVRSPIAAAPLRRHGYAGMASAGAAYAWRAAVVNRRRLLSAMNLSQYISN